MAKPYHPTAMIRYCGFLRFGCLSPDTVTLQPSPNFVVENPDSTTIRNMVLTKLVWFKVRYALPRYDFLFQIDIEETGTIQCSLLSPVLDSIKKNEIEKAMPTGKLDPITVTNVSYTLSFTLTKIEELALEEIHHTHIYEKAPIPRSFFRRLFRRKSAGKKNCAGTTERRSVIDIGMSFTSYPA